MTQLICVVCPKGCHLQVDEKNGYSVEGASCERGKEYGRIELTDPRRVVTSTVAITGAAHPRVPVKTDKAVQKKDIFKIMEKLDKIILQSPVAVGQIVIENVMDSGANVVVTRNL